MHRTVTSAPSVSADQRVEPGAAVGELVGDRRLGGGAGERQLGPTPLV